jgi:asparagine synthase (glutamine-hydrolysing)
VSEALAHRPVDAKGQWIKGSIGLSHRAFFTTPESAGEQQPMHDQDRRLAVTFDGRIDNREELLKSLRLPPTCSDADIVLSAYAKWRDDCPIHLIGDFAFALWDEVNQELFCARDFPGIRPFYYCCDGNRFVCSTELHQILQLQDFDCEINEGMVGEFLTGTVYDCQETLYRHILRLAPGHCMRIGSTYQSTRRYWDGHDIKPLIYDNDDQYVEHVLTTLNEAVRCRLRGLTTVGVYLSGGLDSSALAAIAHNQDIDLRAFTFQFPNHPDCDESKYCHEMSKFLSIPLTTLVPGAVGPSIYGAQARQYRDLPDYPGGTMRDVLHEAAAAQGIRVVLTGNGGDECFSRAGNLWVEWLHAGRFSKFLNDFRREFSFKSVNLFLRQGIWPLMPLRIRRLKHRLSGASLADDGLMPDFIARVKLGRRIGLRFEAPRHWSPANRLLYQRFVSGYCPHAYEYDERAAARFGIEERHPFLDRRMIELALSLPEDQRIRMGIDRYIQRYALRGLLPEKIRQRQDKADFSHVYVEALKQCFGKAQDFRDFSIVRNGWVDPIIAKDMLESTMGGYSTNASDYRRHMWPLWMFYSLETWLAALRQR